MSNSLYLDNSATEYASSQGDTTTLENAYPARTEESNALLTPDINTKFKIGDKITATQKAFFEKYGFIHFKNVFTRAETAEIKKELEEAQKQLIADKKTFVNGVPLKYGYGLEGQLLIQRLPFSSTFSKKLSVQVNRKEIKTLLTLVPNSRVGEREKDGVVANHYVNGAKSSFKRMGWHTDALRDIFYLQKVRPMLNVGIHLDDCPSAFGGLRIIPGTHNQGIWNMLFGKPYFINHTPDKNEIAVETEEGDLTIHDGRLWHRAEAPSTKAKGYRRVIYFPIITGPYTPKNDNSSTPLYLRLMKTINPFKK